MTQWTSNKRQRNGRRSPRAVRNSKKKKQKQKHRKHVMIMITSPGLGAAIPSGPLSHPGPTGATPCVTQVCACLKCSGPWLTGLEIRCRTVICASAQIRNITEKVVKWVQPSGQIKLRDCLSPFDSSGPGVQKHWLQNLLAAHGTNTNDDKMILQRGVRKICGCVLKTVVIIFLPTSPSVSQHRWPN